MSDIPGIRAAVLAAMVLLTPAPRASAVPAPDFEALLAASKLRQYCKACHGLGRLRFIYGNSDEALWQYLFTAQAPVSQKLWAARILETLSWPSDEPPSFEQPMEPPDKDWMPKGAKRMELAADSVGSLPTRRFLIETLRRYLP